MKKSIVLSVFVVVIVLLILSAWLVNIQFNTYQTQIAELQAQNDELQSQNSDLQNQTISLKEQNKQLRDQIRQLQDQMDPNYSSPVKIVSFEWIGGYQLYSGLTQIHLFNVTIHNVGSYGVSWLSLETRLVDRYSGAKIGLDHSIGVDFLLPGDRREIQTGALTWIETSLDNATCIVTLSSANMVLDEWTQNIS